MKNKIFFLYVVQTLFLVLLLVGVVLGLSAPSDFWQAPLYSPNFVFYFLCMGISLLIVILLQILINITNHDKDS